MSPKKVISNKTKKLAATFVAGLSTISPAFAVDPDRSARSILTVVFNIFLFAGIVLLGVGVYMIGKAVSEGENAPPGAIGKGIAFAIAGLILCFAKWFVEKILGVNIDSFSFFG